MGPEQIRDTAGQQLVDRSRKKEIEALHELLVRELRRRESAASPAQADETMEPAQPRKSVIAAFVGLALVVAVPRMIGLAIWGSDFDEPHWWDLASDVLIVAGILDVIAALKDRVSGA